MICGVSRRSYRTQTFVRLNPGLLSCDPSVRLFGLLADDSKANFLLPIVDGEDGTVFGNHFVIRVGELSRDGIC